MAENNKNSLQKENFTPAKSKKNSTHSKKTKSAKKKKDAKKLNGILSDNHRRFFIGFAIAVGAFLFFGAIFLGLYDQFLRKYEQKFYPGVSVANIDLSGLSYIEGLNAVQEKIDTLYLTGVIFDFPDAVEPLDGSSINTLFQLPPTTIPLSAAGTARETYSVETEKSLDEAYAIGRTGNLLLQFKQQFFSWKYGHNIQLTHTIDTDYITEALQEFYSSFETPPKNAGVLITENGDVEIEPEKPGKVFNYNEITALAVERIQNFDSDPIFLRLETVEPRITSDDVSDDIVRIESYLERTPIELTWEGQSWTYDRATVGNWLTYETDSLNIDIDALKKSLTIPDSLITIKVKEARWKVEKDEGGNSIGLTQLVDAQNGRGIKYKKTADAILAYLEGSKTSPELIVGETKPQFSTENADELGINTLLGTGHSAMPGSSYNRRLNISRGVELLNGLLIAPDEEFSLLDTLAPFTAENGYVAELVIKGNETIPEIGGGLCQVGTTTFRGAMNTGLEITERRNHSFAVPYYFDDANGLPGTDATIYEGSPDFKFINNTPGYILLQTRIDGDDLYFDYWGTDDGRIASFTPPEISGWVNPPPVKEIPTTELAPGQRRCTESAYPGTSASFDYIVDYPESSEFEDYTTTYNSYYKPWQAVCLVGAEPEKPPAEEESPPTTEENKEKKKKS